MEFVYLIASTVWLFFSALGTVGTMPLMDVLEGVDITVDNPFNSNEWDIETGSFGDLTTQVFDWILDFIDLPDLTVFESMLFITVVVFALGFIVRMISSLTLD